MLDVLVSSSHGSLISLLLHVSLAGQSCKCRIMAPRILAKLIVLDSGFVMAIDNRRTNLVLKIGVESLEPSRWNGTLILRKPIKTASTSEKLQRLRSAQSRESLGSVAGLAQMRLEVRMAVFSTDCVPTSPLGDRNDSFYWRSCKDAKPVS